MRADVRNTGRSPLLRDGELGDASIPIRRWSTGNGIFSTPIIGADETIYVGSADKSFYAFDPVSGAQRWSFPTGECIDSAGCIGADDTIYFVSCDAGLYALGPSGEERWRLNLFEGRKHFTPSTIFWWEGNVVLGSNGLLYAGNDDFNFYAIEPRRGVCWAYLTGLHIWTAPAFGDDGSVYFLSFDRHCYKLDRDSGRVRWRTNTGNFVVSSPALDNDGGVFFGSFDGHVYALDGDSGRIRWRVATAGPIYASPALADDDTLYIGSSDGCLYAVDAGRGRVVWSFYTGDAIRASAAIGLDPERQCPYLVYFGSGNGVVYCVEPGGRRRWSLRTVAEGSELDSPNINASIALGRSGLAAATASGKVFYIPYNYYSTHAGDPALDRRGGDGYPAQGIFLYPISPGGGMALTPLNESTTAILAEPSQPVSLRVLGRQDGQTRPARFDPDGIEVTMDPPRAFRVTLQPDRGQINVVPAAGVTSATGSLTVRADCHIDGHGAASVEGRLPLRFLPAVDAPPIAALLDMPFRITHMSVYNPTIVPSFDQIGIASLTIQARVVHIDPPSGRVVAWGVEKFGIAADGDAVQVAVPRYHFYAFQGT
jgi:outer membrane protein assembly factor BamB